MSKPLSVLLIEDSDDDALLLTLALRRGGYDIDFLRVETHDAMRAALRQKQWDVIIADYVLPQFSGLDALTMVRESGLDTPFIIVSGKIGEDTAVSAMKAGANDYILKGNIFRLIPAIERELHEAEIRSEKYRAERALLESEKRYRQLVSAVTDYIYTVRIDHGSLFRTSHGPGCYGVTGYEPEDFAANPDLWYQMIYEEDRAEVMEKTRMIHSGTDIPSLEHRIVHKNGSVRWVRNTIVPRVDDSGRLIGYDGLVSDITDRKNSEEALRLQSTALNAAANAIVITNREGRIIWTNPAFTQLTGYEQEEVLGKNPSILNSGKHPQTFYQKMWETVIEGEVWHGELINRRKDGSFYAEEQTITPVPDERGRINHFIAIKQDITERKKSDLALLENARLRRDMELAQQIQRSLLPSFPPAAKGVRLAGYCVPAAHVGGDYYDFFTRDDACIDLVIADVSGHGIGQAIIMAETRSVLHAQAVSFASPEEILTSLNRLLYDDLTRAELFISMFYISYNPENRMVRYANAGHTSPILHRFSDETFEHLDAEGIVLGVVREEVFEGKSVEMREGDILLLYTDGIIETRDELGEFFGVDRLCALLFAYRSKPPQEIAEKIYREVSAFAGGTPPEDDISMVILKAVPE